MYKDNKILVGKNEKTSAYILPEMANRHGLITGASGSGKTVTMKVLSEKARAYFSPSAFDAP